MYKLALIYELMNGHTHLPHSFVIIAFSLKLLKDSSKSIVFPFPHISHVYGEEQRTLNIQCMSRAPRDVTQPTHTFLKPFDSHDMREPCNLPEPRLSREEGG